ncbi:MAG: sugar ABC transporter permease [Christensenellaceae bacterium]
MKTIFINMYTTLKKESSRRRAFIFLFLAPTMLCFCMFYLYPILTVFATSFSKWDFSNVAKPEFYGIGELFTNYKYIFTVYPYFWEALRNSVIWAMLGVFVQVPIAVVVALALSRKMRGWVIIRNIYIIPNVISTAALSLIFLQLYNPKYGIVNQFIQLFNPTFTDNILLLPVINFIAMTCAYIFFTGYTTVLLLGNVMAVPEEIYEAALMDGASGFKRDLYITLPIIKDSIKTVSVLAATSGFLIYNEVFFLTRGAAGTRSISYVIRELAIMSPKTQFARANTVGVVQVVMGLVLVALVTLMYSLPYGKIFGKIRGRK